jgi:hypothetical protein
MNKVRIVIQCIICPNKFEVVVSRSKAKYCSMKCMGIERKGKQPWLGKHHSQATKLKISIANSGKIRTQELKDKMSKALKGRPSPNKGKKLSEEWKRKISENNTRPMLGKHFSLETRQKISKSKMGHIGPRGELSSLWKGGICRPIILIRSSTKYTRWRTEVFTRDNYTCQICGDNKGGNLEADHIIKLSNIIDSLIKQFGGFTEEVRNHHLIWDINNGRTLCHECHKKTENYGSKKQ